MEHEELQHLLLAHGDILLRGFKFLQVKEDDNFLSYILGGGRPKFRDKTLNEKVSEVLNDDIFEDVGSLTWKIVQRMLEFPEKFMTRCEWERKDLKEEEFYISNSNVDYLIDTDTEVIFTYSQKVDITCDGLGIKNEVKTELRSPECFNSVEKKLLQNCIQKVVEDKHLRWWADHLQAQRDKGNEERIELIDKYKEV